MDRVKEYAIWLKLSVGFKFGVGKIDLFINEHGGVRETPYDDAINRVRSVRIV